MPRKHSIFARKIIVALLFSAFLNLNCVSAYAFSFSFGKEKKQLPPPDTDTQVAVLKDAFTSLYWEHWGKHNMSDHLYDCIVKAVDDYSGIAAFANEKDYAKVQERVNTLFDAHFKPFLDDLLKAFAPICTGQVLFYYRDLLEAALIKVDDVTSKAKLQETSDQLLKESSAALKGKISENANASRITGTQIGVTAAIGFAAKYAVTSMLSSVAAQSGMLSMAGSVGSKFASAGGIASFVVAVPILAMGAVKISNGAESMRVGLFDPMLRNYLYTVPDVFWQPYESPIRASFEDVYTGAMISVTEADKDFEVDKDLSKLMKEYKKKKGN